MSSTIEPSAINDYPWESFTLPQVVDQVIARHPEKVFLKSADSELTYAELARRSVQLAGSMIAMQLPVDQPIAVALPAGADWAVAVLAVMRAGYIYVPLDPSFPEERNRKIVKNSGVSLVIGALSLEGLESIKQMSIDELLATQSDVLDDNAWRSRQDSVACIIYTSGSSGTPKGVIQTHQSILHGAWRRGVLQGITASDRMTWLYSPSVKGTEYCFYVALLHGASLHARKIMDHQDDQLIDWLEDQKITVFHSVASYFRYVAGALSASPHSLHDLRLVILGGERVLKTDVDLFFQNFPERCELFTGLGSTETGTVCYLPFASLRTLDLPIVPIGLPAPGVKVEVDKDTTDDAVGVMLVQSRFISPGYWNEPSDRFHVDSETGETVYRSGDLAELKSDGFLHHRGRADQSVKISGYLVSLIEVESALMNQPGVTEAIVKADEVDAQSELSAFIEVDSTFSGVDAMRKALEECLVAQMRPRRVQVMKSWPRLANGKIDRSKLVVDVSEPVVVAEMTEMEERVLDVWKKVLKVDSVPVNQLFVEAGGDSIRVLRMALEFKKAGIKGIELSHLEELDTIAKQAKWAEQQERAEL